MIELSALHQAAVELASEGRIFNSESFDRASLVFKARSAAKAAGVRVPATALRSITTEANGKVEFSKESSPRPNGHVDDELRIHVKNVREKARVMVFKKTMLDAEFCASAFAINEPAEFAASAVFNNDKNIRLVTILHFPDTQRKFELDMVLSSDTRNPRAVIFNTQVDHVFYPWIEQMLPLHPKNFDARKFMRDFSSMPDKNNLATILPNARTTT